MGLSSSTIWTTNWYSFEEMRRLGSLPVCADLSLCLARYNFFLQHKSIYSCGNRSIDTERVFSETCIWAINSDYTSLIWERFTNNGTRKLENFWGLPIANYCCLITEQCFVEMCNQNMLSLWNKLFELN